MAKSKIYKKNIVFFVIFKLIIIKIIITSQKY